MCGIVGCYHPGQAGCGAELVLRISDRMPHRGPDGVGVWTSADHRCTLGHRRLSIIDLSDVAAQPMSNGDGTVTVTVNGEIYKHADLLLYLAAVGKYPL